MDQFFKDKLDQYQSKVPHSAWEGIDTRLSEEQVNTRPFLWILLIAMVLLTLGYLFYKDVISPAEDAPVEIEDNAIASTESLPRSFKVNYYQKEEDNIYYVSPEKLVLSDALKSDLSSNKPFQRFLVTSGPTVQQVEMNSTDALFDLQTSLQAPKLLSTNTELTGKETITIAWPDYKDYCYSNSNHYFFIEFNAGLDFPFQKLGVQHFASEAQHYREQRSLTEYGSVSYNANLLAGYIHPTGLLAKTGIQYAQLNEKFYLVKESVVKIQTKITIDTMFKEDGSYVINRDTTTAEIMGEEKLTTNNHFRMVDVPLIIGYRYTGSNFGIEVNTGLIFNIMNYSSGRIYDEEIHPTYYGAKGDGYFSPFKTRVGLSLYAGIRYMTGFYGRTQFYVEPNLRYYFNSFSNNDFPLSQKYMVLGITSGMKYFF